MLLLADLPSRALPVSLRQGEMQDGLPLRGFRSSRHTKTEPFTFRPCQLEPKKQFTRFAVAERPSRVVSNAVFCSEAA